MRLGDLFSGGQSVGDHARTSVQAPGAAGQAAAGYQASGSRLPNLTPGQTIQGDVVSKNGNEVQIRTSDDQIINARLDHNIHLEVGKTVTFEVRNNGRALTLSPLFENTATDPNVMKALSQASLPVNGTTVSMTEQMMKAGMPVDRNSLQQMFREVNNFPKTDVSNIVDLHRLSLPVNENNLTQIESYKNLTHQLINGMQQITEQIPNVIEGMLNDGDVDGAVRLYQELLELVSSSGGELAATDPAVMAGEAAVLPEGTLAVVSENAAGAGEMPAAMPENTANAGETSAVMPENTVNVGEPSAVMPGDAASAKETPAAMPGDAASAKETPAAIPGDAVSAEETPVAVPGDAASAREPLAAVLRDAVSPETPLAAAPGDAVREGKMPAVMPEDAASAKETPAAMPGDTGNAVKTPVAAPEPAVPWEGTHADIAGAIPEAEGVPGRTEVPSKAEVREMLPGGREASAQTAASQNTVFAKTVFVEEELVTGTGTGEPDGAKAAPRPGGESAGAVKENAGADFLRALQANMGGAEKAEASGNADQAGRMQLSVIEDALINKLPLSPQQQTELRAQLAAYANGELSDSQSMELVGRLLQLGVNQHEQGRELAAALLRDKGVQRLLGDALEKAWTIRPQELRDSDTVEELYRHLNRQLKGLSHALESAGQSGSQAAQSVTQLSQNVDFLQQVNQMYTYVQLPLRFQEGEAHGELYVYTNKKNLAKRDGNVSALLHLDMEHLGPVDVYVAMQSERVSTRFYVQDEEMLDFLNGHMDLLTERLQKRGYSCSCEMTVRSKENTGPGAASGGSGIGPILDSQQGMMLVQYSFDVRA